ncbi:DUF4232 domain-containing protein [Streptomyces sp. NPDC058221]|uniref:DUF4232 domain-containing protein n=1 Tax=Streptomyces sp. NPDC058221 TaxID=3346388 RepID=UPI0036DFD3B2
MRSNSIRTTVLAASALLAALSLTACSSGDNGSTSDNGKAGAAAPAANSAAKQAQPPAAAPEDATDVDAGTQNGATAKPKTIAQPATNAKSGGKGATGSTDRASRKTGNSTTPVTCTGANTKTAVSKVTRPVNHLLLTVTNTGNRTCYAYHAPKLRFDDAQAVFPILDASRPQAVVTLDPGQSAYASIGLSSGEDDQNNLHESKNLGVYFSGRNAEGSTGTPANLTLPAGTSWGDNGFVTYWQTEMADALQY